MEIYHIVLSNAFVAFLTAPLRRLRYLLTVEDDLIEEGILPPQGFGGTMGCMRFLYYAGGRSLSVFYRGAALEALGLVGKYELQRFISIPISRRMPLRMQHAVLATTFVHTALVYFTVAPLQAALDTIAVNSVTTFTAETTPPHSAAKEHKGKDAAPAAGSAETKRAQPSPSSPKVRLRFSSALETAKYLAVNFPVREMVSRLYLLDFGCRYMTSLANNTILTWLMTKAQRHYNGVEMTSFQRLVMYAGFPLVASLAMSVLTYPFATYPVAHFLRLRYYERRNEEEEASTTTAARHGSTAHRATKDGASIPSNSGTSASAAKRTDAHGRPGVVERLWWEEAFHRAVHSEVRDYLWRSMYSPEGSAAALASASTSTSAMPTCVSSMSAAEAQECPVGAGGCSSSKRGVRQLYRGFGLVVTSTLLSSALAIALNRAVDFVAQHSH
ncbi:hypothetical protein ABL78_5961 [Leptomonas seymouri]|uniref:Mitochondrial carrier protein n=1 Tax=Leptomonas seymouri TaxID=5684 RepID=A0A0N1IIR7_LEPSE|nr:hypothetical protein ABL78_5961 [Leptomonas seymouri]|eukprot:KPI84995.1 hypothetical protein ABL78_5961 [Leptomonas seymouri]